MPLAKQAKMVEKLAELTDAGAIDWKPSVNEGTFQVSFRDNTLRITTRDSRDGFDIVIQLLNGNGELVETITDVELAADTPIDEPGGWFGLMSDLYENARRKALGADKVLDEIIADLDSTIPF